MNERATLQPVQITEAMQAQARALADPSRFRLFRFIADADQAVGVAELTELLGFNHNAIRQHLAILVEAQLVTESNEDRKVRGRPRKQYELRADALSAFGSVSGSYERLAKLLLALADGDDPPFEVGLQAGRARAAATATRPATAKPIDGLVHQLAVDGFEPIRVSDTTISLHHCPFADVAALKPGIVCELHRGLINGQLTADDDETIGTLEPRDPMQAGCLVGVEPQRSNS